MNGNIFNIKYQTKFGDWKNLQDISIPTRGRLALKMKLTLNLGVVVHTKKCLLQGIYGYYFWNITLAFEARFTAY